MLFGFLNDAPVIVWMSPITSQHSPEVSRSEERRVSGLEATTTKRSGVTTETILRWHGTVDGSLEEMDRRNYWHSG